MAEIPEAEFLKWYPVPVAVEILVRSGFDPGTVRDFVFGLLLRDEIRSAALQQHKEATDGGKDEFLPRATLRRPHWSRDTITDAFWEKGEADLRKEKVGNFIYHCTGIRFHWADIDKLVTQKQPPAPVPVPTSSASGQKNRLGPDEFDQWVTLREMIAAIPIAHRETKRRSIQRRLADGLLVAAAETVADRSGTQMRAVLPKKTWEGLGTDDDFWDTAEFEHITASSTGYERWVDFRCYGVRFNPADVTRFVSSHAVRDAPLETVEQRSGPAPPVPGASPSPPSTDSRPKVPPRDLEAWAKRFGERNPGAPFGAFLANARLELRQFRVGERPMKAAIAKIGMTRSPGNPSTLR